MMYQKFQWLLTAQADFPIPVSDCHSNFRFIFGSSGSQFGITVCLQEPDKLFPLFIDQTPFPFGLFYLNYPLQNVPLGKIHFPQTILSYSQFPISFIPELAQIYVPFPFFLPNCHHPEYVSLFWQEQVPQPCLVPFSHCPKQPNKYHNIPLYLYTQIYQFHVSYYSQNHHHTYHHQQIYIYLYLPLFHQHNHHYIDHHQDIQHIHDQYNHEMIYLELYHLISQIEMVLLLILMPFFYTSLFFIYLCVFLQVTIFEFYDFFGYFIQLFIWILWMRYFMKERGKLQYYQNIQKQADITMQEQQIQTQSQQQQQQQQQQPRRKLQIIAVSDTHGSNKIIEQATKGVKGDIFIHAGDFTKRGRQDSFKDFFDLLDRIDFKYKIVVAGNHQIMLDNGHMDQKQRQKCLEKYPCKMSRQQIIAELKKRCIYLEHQSVQIQGVKIFGSPYTLMYCNTAFQYQPQLDQVIWKKVPQNVDVLITHCPPFGILDKSNKDKNGGSKALRAVSLDRKPKYHIFGHIHEANGMQKIGETMYLNVAKSPIRLMI